MQSEPTLTIEPTLTTLEGEGSFIVCTACGPTQRLHVSMDGIYTVTCLICRTGKHVCRLSRPHYWEPEPAPAPVRGAPPAHYGCHNRPASTPPYFARNGYGEGRYKSEVHMGEGNWLRTQVWKKVMHVMSTDCRYDKRGTDAKCDGCTHR
jgi:hypothetical protein